MTVLHYVQLNGNLVIALMKMILLLQIAGSHLPSESPSGGENIEEMAKRERLRIEELLKSKGMQHGSFPKFSVAVKGQKVVATDMLICLH